MEYIVSTGMCGRCSECCKNYPFVELSKSEVNSLEQVTGLHFDVFTIQKGQVAEEFVLQFQESGDCFFLKEANGGYFCSVYAARPGICKKYPLEPVQKEVCHANMEKVMSVNFG